VNGFSNEWDEIYLDNLQITSWPWTDLVSLVYRHCKDIILSGNGAVLELGSGAGPNIPFIQSLKMDYYGIEGSPTVVKRLHQKYPELKETVIVSDFTNIKSFIGIPKIDIVIDRASVTHNNLPAIQDTLKNCYRKLNNSGYFIGIDWFSTKHADFKLGVESVDKNTRMNIKSGQFENVGNVHFSNKKHLRSLFSDYEIVVLEEKVINSYVSKIGHQFASWNIVAKKK